MMYSVIAVRGGGANPTGSNLFHSLRCDYETSKTKKTLTWLSSEKRDVLHGKLGIFQE